MYERGLSIYFCSRLIWYYVRTFIFKVPYFLSISFLYQLLGVFAELLKATISFVMSIRLTVHVEQFEYHWADFYEILHLSIFQESAEKIQVFFLI
jgi:hypothetical protein